jgi:hypothetical protein
MTNHPSHAVVAEKHDGKFLYVFGAKRRKFNLISLFEREAHQEAGQNPTSVKLAMQTISRH